MKLATKGGYEFKDGVLRKTVSKKKHLMRVYDGWAVQKDILQDLPPETVVEIHDKDENKTYRATRKDFWSQGTTIKYGTHGEQVVLARSRFTV